MRKLVMKITVGYSPSLILYYLKWTFEVLNLLYRTAVTWTTTVINSQQRTETVNKQLYPCELTVSYFFWQPRDQMAV